MRYLLIILAVVYFVLSTTMLKAQTVSSPTAPALKTYFRHDFGLGISRGSTEGYGLGYDLLARRGAFGFGIGVTYGVLDRRRDELLTGATLLAEYHTGTTSWRPIFRLKGGLGLPVGTSAQPIDKRSLSTIVHPSVAVMALRAKRPGSGLLMDLGYRLTKSSFSFMDWSSQVERDITYRRITLTLAYRL